MTKLFLRFFRWYCHPKLRSSIEGDLIELHREREERLGKRRADVLFAFDVILLFRPGIIRPSEGHHQLNQYGMFKSYFKIGWRTMLRSKGYSAINIGGLALGMTVTILIGMWIFDELSWNKSFENYDRTGQVMVHNGDGTHPSNPVPLAGELRSNFPQYFKKVSLCSWPWELAVVAGDKKFIEQGIFMEAGGPEIFSLNMIYGSRKAPGKPKTVVISESLSKKLFGDADPNGQTIRVKNSVDATVTGVYKDFPSNSALYQLNLIGSWDFLYEWMSWMRESQSRWDNNSFKLFVQLQDGVSFEEVSDRIKDLKKPHLNAERLKDNPQLFVHPMSKWHLYSTFGNRQIITSDAIQLIWLYSTIGTFVLILACINFMNLSTARSEKRAKEVGIRKTMGSLRQQLITQFLSESFITVMIATIFSMVMVLLVLPYFNDIAAKQIAFPWTNSFFWVAILCFILIAGLMAGSYPALYLSSFKPVKILKARTTSLPRKILVVAQFTVSVTLIVGTIIVYQQIQFAKDRPVGYDRYGLIKVHMITPDLYKHYQAIRSELMNAGFAENVADANGPTTDVWSNTSGITWEGKPDAMESDIAVNWVTTSYGPTIGWKISDGRDFSDEIASDSSAIVISRTAARYMSMQDPVGKEIRWDENRYHVIGVIEDMVIGSPYQPIKPAIFFHTHGDLYTMNIRLNRSLGLQEAMAGVESVFTKYTPSVPFQFSFVDDDYNNKFASEVRVGKLASVFAALAILISLLGLFGLSAFIAEQRTKEIGIRKVIGASITQLWAMLTKSFVFLVGISCLIAFPIAWYALSGWLTRFEYRIEISPWIFPIVIAGALAITLATVSYQAIRAALANPVDSLKAE
ncbi:MAG: ABC transporter permease [Bacteroidota bacterium]